MNEGISNFQIEEAFRNLNNQDISDNFVGAFPANHMNKFIDYKSMISDKKEKYIFLIETLTALIKKVCIGGAYWALNQKGPIFFYSFGVDGLKKFITEDDKNVVEKILFGREQLTRTDNKITLVNIKFNLNACKNLSKKEFDNLSNTARDFF